MKSYLEEVSKFINYLILKKNLMSIKLGNGFIELLLFQKVKFKKILLIDIEKTDTQNHGLTKMVLDMLI